MGKGVAEKFVGRSAASAASGHSPSGLSQSSLSQAEPSVPNAVYDLCEQFINQAILRREVSDELPASAAWQRLPQFPVVVILAVEPLKPGEYALDIDSSGDGWVRLRAGLDRPSITVRYTVGMAETMDSVPLPLVEGMKRLARHLEETPNEPPPAAVTALWRPYRRLRLS